MKIAGAEVGIITWVYAGLTVAMGAMLLSLYVTRYDLIVESWYRERVTRAFNSTATEDMQQGIQGCEKLLEKQPNNIRAQLCSAALYFKNGQFDKAKVLYENAAANPQVPSEIRAEALTAAAVSHFRNAPKELQALSISASADLLRQAVAASDVPDAAGNLLLTESWGTITDWAGLVPRIDKILAATPPPTFALQEQLYYLKGVALVNSGKAIEGVAELDRAKGLHPDWRVPDEAKRKALLASLFQNI